MRLIGLPLVVILALGTVAWADHDIDVPYEAPEAAVSVDGNLGEWAGDAWVMLDTAYSGTPADITSARYAVRWSDAENLLYVACEVVDTQQHLEDAYVAWNAQDDIEVYVDAANNDMAYSSSTDGYAQQIVFGVSGTNVAWANTEDTNLVPAYAVVDLGDTLVYEIAIVPYSYYAGNGGTAEPEATVDLAADMDIGLDVVAGTLMDDLTFAMISNNSVPSKFRMSQAMQTWTLVSSGNPADFDGDGDVDLDDFVILKNNFGVTPPAGGDADGDGDVDLDDFVILKNAFGS